MDEAAEASWARVVTTAHAARATAHTADTKTRLCIGRSSCPTRGRQLSRESYGQKRGGAPDERFCRSSCAGRPTLLRQPDLPSQLAQTKIVLEKREFRAVQREPDSDRSY